jgi:hypothetical protein
MPLIFDLSRMPVSACPGFVSSGLHALVVRGGRLLQQVAQCHLGLPA